MFFDEWAANSKNNKFWHLDLFLAGAGLNDQSKQLFQNISRVYADYDVWRKFVVSNNESCSVSDVMPQASDELLLCTSSGTTDTPKKIKHTHEFLFEISYRNEKIFKFDGNVLHLKNLFLVHTKMKKYFLMKHLLAVELFVI